MPKTVGQLISNIAVLAGIPATDERLKDLLSISTEVPDEVFSTINSNVMNLDAAKNNPTLKSHFMASALNGVDATLNDIYEELGVSPEVRKELEAETNTYKRVRLMANKVKELEAKKTKSGDSGDKQKYADEIAKLNQQIADMKESSSKELETLKEQHQGQVREMLIRNQLAGVDYAYDLPKDVNIQTAMNLLQQELKNKKASVVIDGNELKLVNAESPEMVYLEDHRPVNFSDFRDKVLANNKLLKVQNPGKTNGGGNTDIPPGGTDTNVEGVNFYDAQMKRVSDDAQ